MKPSKNSNLFQSLWLFVLTGIVLLTGTAYAIFRTPSIFFALGSCESFSLLLAQGYFSSLTKDLLPANAFPLQQISLPMVLGIFLSNWILIQAKIIAWFAQNILGILFLWRVQSLLSPGHPRFERSLLLGLLLIHPYFWIQLCTSPSQILTAWLVLEILVDIRKTNGLSITGWAGLLLLSLNGCEGYIWTVILSASIAFVQIVPIRENVKTCLEKAAFPLSALIPMGLAYVILTWQFGVWGGCRVTGFPSFFSEFSLFQLLTGEWSVNTQDLLVWLSNGFLTLPVFFPLFGILVTIGILSSWGKTSPDKELNRTAGILFLFSLFFFSFTPIAASHTWVTPLLPIAVYFAITGMRWTSTVTLLAPRTIPVTGSGILAITGLLCTPSEWNPVFEKARYYHTICQTLNDWQKEIPPQDSSINNAIAVRFHPIVFSHVPSKSRIYPAGLGYQALFNSHLGEHGGIYFDLRFAPAPEKIILYPLFNEESNSDFPSHFLNPQTELELNRYYQSSRMYNFWVYQRTANPSTITQDWLRSAYNEGYFIETEIVPPWFDTFFPPSPIAAQPIDIQSLPKPVGLSWTFETNFQNTQQTGLAFGLNPSSNNRASGIQSAGTSHPGTVNRCGQLESIPFIIEGNEMTFFANLPKDSTASLFCLAVYDEAPFGENATIQQAKHIFERQENEPLMKDTFFYIRPSHLSYWPGKIRGWRVVRLLQESLISGWQFKRWSLDPWINRQALWMAADRSWNDVVQIDQIIQWNRVPGWYANFENGHYKTWRQTGGAFTAGPSVDPIGNQSGIQDMEGNFFINSYHYGSDEAMGTLVSPAFELKWKRMEFRIAGGKDIDRLYAGLRINGQLVLRETGDKTEHFRRVSWDTTPWIGQTVQVEIADHSPDEWGHILVDDIRIY